MTGVEQDRERIMGGCCFSWRRFRKGLLEVTPEQTPERRDPELCDCPWGAADADEVGRVGKLYRTRYQKGNQARALGRWDQELVLRALCMG